MMVPKTYEALDDALEEGLGFALNRVLDALPCPHENDGELHQWRERVREEMRTEVMNAIHARFRFEEPAEP